MNITFPHNNIPDKNKKLVLKCSVKSEALLLLENTGKCLDSDDTKRYGQILLQLQNAFTSAKEKISLRREFYRNQQNYFEKAAKLYMNKLEFKKKNGVGFNI